MKALVFLEHHGDAIAKGSLGVLTKAAAAGSGDVAAALVGGPRASVLAAEAGRFGATTVHLVTGEVFEPALPHPRVDALATIVEAAGYDTVLFSNSVLAADVAAGLAARLECGLNWDLVDLTERDGALVGTRQALGDSILVEVGWRSKVRLALFRSGSFDPIVVGDQSPRVDEVPVTLKPHAGAVRVVEQRTQPDEGPSLEDAEVVVTGGMGLGAKEHFTLAEELAKVLGGVVGATRAVVYAGWYPHAAQVGQTGKTVSPKLYIALGVSGAVQHKVGMQGSKTIVAVNKDPNAPIFEFSDLAVVGDVHTVVPQLVALLEQRKGS